MFFVIDIFQYFQSFIRNPIIIKCQGLIGFLFVHVCVIGGGGMINVRKTSKRRGDGLLETFERIQRVKSGSKIAIFESTYFLNDAVLLIKKYFSSWRRTNTRIKTKLKKLLFMTPLQWK